MLFCQCFPRATLLCGLILQRAKRAVKIMSIQDASQHDFNQKRLIANNSGSLQIHTTKADHEDSDTGVKTCNDMQETNRKTEKQFTEDELAIHKLHREACEAKRQMYTDPGSGYKVFTEFAHRQRGKCCGTACRHCPFGQVNVKDPANKKHFNSMYYV